MSSSEKVTPIKSYKRSLRILTQIQVVVCVLKCSGQVLVVCVKVVVVLRCAVVSVSVVRAAAREEAVVRLQGLTTLGSRLISTVLE